MNTIIDNNGTVRIYLEDITDLDGKIDIDLLNRLDDLGIRVRLGERK